MSLKKVKIVSKRANGTNTVYDICVPVSHHYLLDSGIVSHNSGFIYASSIVVAMKKLKLKEDEDGNKISEVRGIRASCKIMKTRYAKPFENVQIKIPYEQGMNLYSGLVDLFEGKGYLSKDGNRLKYNLADGTELKFFRKEWERNEEQCLDKIMHDVMNHPHKKTSAVPDEDTQ